MTRSRRAITGAVCLAEVTASSSALAATPSRGHLTIGALSPAPPAPGATFSERYTEQNVGKRRAGASTTAFYLPTFNSSGEDRDYV
jgi:hypothetical protein